MVGPSRWASIWRVSLALLIAAGAAGCHGERPTPKPRAAAPSGFPVTVTDDLGHQVTVERKPERIVSLAPNVTEMLFALGLGERVVGVSENCNYPPEAKRKPKVGGYARPSAERILSVRPDLVIASRGNPPEVLRQLERAGVAVYGADPQTIDQVIALARRLGRLTGEAQAGRSLASDLGQRVKRIRARTSRIPEDQRPQVVLIVSDEPLFVAGSETFLDDLITSAGGRNAAADYRGFSKLSQEAAATLTPDVIITTVGKVDADGEVIRVPGAFDHRRVAARPPPYRVCAVDEDVVSRPGPRVPEALERIEKLLHPREKE